MINLKDKIRAALEDVKITPNCEFGFIAVTCDDDGFLAFWGLDVKDLKQARELCDEHLQVDKFEGWQIKDPLDVDEIDFLEVFESEPIENWDSHVAILTFTELKNLEQ